MPASSPTTSVAADDLARLLIPRASLVSCNDAFIDCRTPGSESKENYALIGPGVSQTDRQFVNLKQPHGYNIGGVAMPPGVTNSLHLHFTAEVFLVTRGRYEFHWGADGSDGSFIANPGDVISIPTWIFRGFTNVGAADNFMFTVLGEDDPGGIIWGPDVLRDAAKQGLYLTVDNRLIDTAAGQTLEGVELVEPLSTAEIARLRAVSAAEMRTRVITDTGRIWRQDSLLCTVCPGGMAELASLIGFGFTENREQRPVLPNPHGFSVAALRAGESQGMLRHRLDRSQVVIARSGNWEVALNEAADVVAVLGPEDTLSVPPGSWRSFINRSTEPGELFVVTGGDDRVRIEWDEGVVSGASRAGIGRDPLGYLAPISMLPRRM